MDGDGSTVKAASVAVTDALKEMGYQPLTTPSLVGKSGARHVFDIVAQSEEADLGIAVVDFASAAREVDELPVISLLAKALDIGSCKAIIVATPKLSSSAKHLARLYHIEAVEAEYAGPHVNS